MRLIDADEIIIPCMETTTDDYHAQSMVDEAPTVDAIPIDWILNNERLPKDGKGLNAILDMIEDWWKKNADDSD